MLVSFRATEYIDYSQLDLQVRGSKENPYCHDPGLAEQESPRE